MFRPKRISLHAARKVVSQRTATEENSLSPLLDALREQALPVYVVEKGDYAEVEYQAADIWWPHPYISSSPKDGQRSCFDVMVASDDVDSLWPDYSRPVEKDFKPKKNGRPEYDWDSFWREVVRLALHPDGLPERQADLERIMMEWCESNWGKGGESTVRGKISPLYADLSKAKK